MNANLTAPGTGTPASAIKPLDKSQIPEPVFDSRPELIDFYWEAWSQAWDHVTYQEGIPQSPYMDEAHAWQEVNWIWDTCFMVHFCKYAPSLFPGIESFNNFYPVMYDNLPTTLKIWHVDNPPLFAWTELEYFKLTNDTHHLSALLKKEYLQKHFEFFDHPPTGKEFPYGGREIHLKKEDRGYTWTGIASGMDNTPRGSGKEYDQFLWIDALAQQGLSALSLSRLAEADGDNTLAASYKEKYEGIKNTINSHYWDEQEGFYFDINKDDDGSFNRVWTPASYWPMLAEMCTEEQAESLRSHAENPELFGSLNPWPSVAHSDPHHDRKGRYWRGGIWLPTAYMATKALEKYNYLDTAAQLADNLVSMMERTYRNHQPNSIWEAYSPSEDMPSTYKSREDGSGGYKKEGETHVIPEFCGWSALGPISLLIENILGFHKINAQTRTVEWHKQQNGRHGIKRLSFGDITTDIIAQDDVVNVSSSGDYELIINGQSFAITTGEQTINL